MLKKFGCFTARDLFFGLLNGLRRHLLFGRFGIWDLADAGIPSYDETAGLEGGLFKALLSFQVDSATPKILCYRPSETSQWGVTMAARG